MKLRRKKEKNDADHLMSLALKGTLLLVLLVAITLGGKTFLLPVIDGLHEKYQDVVDEQKEKFEEKAKKKEDAERAERAEAERVEFLRVRESVMERQGNTPQNLAEGGMLCWKDDELYFIDPGRGNHIFRWTENMGELDEAEELISEECSYLNIWDDWFYYRGEDKQLYRQHIKNGKNECLTDYEDIYEPKFWDGVIYYELPEDDFSLWRMNPDGSGKSWITDGAVLYCCITDERIYFINTYDDRKGYSVKLDGTDRKVWMEKRLGCIDCVDGVIYYSLIDDGGIYRFDNDDPDSAQQISDVHNASFNSYAGWIYFSNRNEDKNRALYKMDLNGEHMTQLTDTPSKMINVAGDWIFFQDGYEDEAENVWKSWYRIKVDGSSKKQIS